MISTSQGTYIGYGYYPYIRINLTTATGTGSIDAVLKCWKSVNYASILGSGGGGSGNPAGATDSIQYKVNGTTFGGDSTILIDPVNHAINLSGSGATPPLSINNIGNSSAPNSFLINFSPTTTSIGSNAQTETIAATTVYSGTGNIATLAGLYQFITDSATAGLATHVFGTVQRIQHTSTGTATLEASYAGDSNITGTGAIGQLATFFDLGRLLGAGTNVNKAYGILLNTTSGAGAPIEDIGIAIPSYNTFGTGTGSNISLLIGGDPGSGKWSIYSSDGNMFWPGQIVNNVNPAANADFYNFTQQDIVGASTGITRGINTVILSSLSGVQVNAGIVGARFSVYSGGGAGTETLQTALEISPGDANSGSTTITQLYGLKVDDLGGNNTVTNYSQLYLGSSHSGGGTYTNTPFGINQTDALNTNLFAGTLVYSKPGSATNDIVCYKAGGVLGHMTITSLLASGSCI
jgi:hypothetical protein